MPELGLELGAIGSRWRISRLSVARWFQVDRHFRKDCSGYLRGLEERQDWRPRGQSASSGRYSAKRHKTCPLPPTSPVPRHKCNSRSPQAEGSRCFGVSAPGVDVWHRITPELRRGGTAKKWTDKWELLNHEEMGCSKSLWYFEIIVRAIGAFK